MCERVFIVMVIKQCENCKEEKEHHAKGLCYSCYKKLKWTPTQAKCRRCQRVLPIHAKGLCASCYNYIFHSESNKAYSQRKTSNVDLKTFRKVTRECVICGFDKIVNLHHIDKNKSNNSPKNLAGLCPNHHRMINNLKFKDEMLLELKKKSFDMPLQSNSSYKKEG